MQDPRSKIRWWEIRHKSRILGRHHWFFNVVTLVVALEFDVMQCILVQRVWPVQASNPGLMSLGVLFFIAVFTVRRGAWQAKAQSVARQAEAGLGFALVFKPA